MSILQSWLSFNHGGYWQGGHGSQERLQAQDSRCREMGVAPSRNSLVQRMLVSIRNQSPLATPGKMPV